MERDERPGLLERVGRRQGGQHACLYPSPRRAGRWIGIHDLPTDHRPGRPAPAQDEAIASCDGDGSGQPQPGHLAADAAVRQGHQVGSSPANRGLDLLRAQVQPECRAFLQASGSSGVRIRPDDRDQGGARLDGRIGGQDGAPGQVAGLDRGQVDRDPAATLERVDRPAVDLQLAGPDRAVSRDQAQERTPFKSPTPERAGHHRAAALDHERAVDRQPDRVVRRAPVRSGQDPVAQVDEGGRQLGQPAAVNR